VQDSDMVGIIIRNEINQRHYFQTEWPDIGKYDLENFWKSVAVEFQVQCPRHFNYWSAFVPDASKFRWY
jgi:hypothetical protein